MKNITRLLLSCAFLLNAALAPLPASADGEYDPIFGIDRIIARLLDASKEEPVNFGQLVNLIHQNAWESLAKDKIVLDVPETFLGEKVETGTFRKVYRTPDGLYEFWIERKVKSKGGDIDIIEWKLGRDSAGNLVKVEAWGDDATSKGPLDPEAKWHNKDHFDRKKKVLEEWLAKVRAKFGDKVEVVGRFSPTDQFFSNERIARLEQLKLDIKAKKPIPDATKRWLALDSPMARLLKGLGLTLAVANVGMAATNFQLELYQSDFFILLRGHLRDKNFDGALRLIEQAKGISVGEYHKAGYGLYEHFVKTGGFLGDLGGMGLWARFMDELKRQVTEAKTKYEEAQKKLRETGAKPLPNGPNAVAAALDGTGERRGPFDAPPVVATFRVNGREYACPVSPDGCREYNFDSGESTCVLDSGSKCKRAPRARAPAPAERAEPMLVNRPAWGCDGKGGVATSNGECCSAFKTHSKGQCKKVVFTPPPPPPVNEIYVWKDRRYTCPPPPDDCRYYFFNPNRDPDPCVLRLKPECDKAKKGKRTPPKYSTPLPIAAKPIAVYDEIDLGGCDGRGGALASDGVTCCHPFTSYFAGPCKNMGELPLPPLPPPVATAPPAPFGCDGMGGSLAPDGVTCCRAFTSYFAGPCKNMGQLPPPPVTPDEAAATGGSNPCTGFGESLSADGTACCKPLTTYLYGPCKNIASNDYDVLPPIKETAVSGGGGPCSGLGESLAKDGKTCCKPLTTYVYGPCKNIASTYPPATGVDGETPARKCGPGEVLKGGQCCKPDAVYYGGPCKNYPPKTEGTVATPAPPATPAAPGGTVVAPTRPLPTAPETPAAPGGTVVAPSRPLPTAPETPAAPGGTVVAPSRPIPSVPVSPAPIPTAPAPPRESVPGTPVVAPSRPIPVEPPPGGIRLPTPTPTTPGTTIRTPAPTTPSAPGTSDNPRVVTPP